MVQLSSVLPVVNLACSPEARRARGSLDPGVVAPVGHRPAAQVDLPDARLEERGRAPGED